MSPDATNEVNNIPNTMTHFGKDKYTLNSYDSLLICL